MPKNSEIKGITFSKGKRFDDHLDKADSSKLGNRTVAPQQKSQIYW